MIAYLDTSVVLRIVLGEPQPLREWHELTVGVSSKLLQVESRCSLWRAHLNERLNADEYADAKHSVDEIIDRLDLLKLTDETLTIAGQPWPKAVHTLDALHLASAVIYRNRQPDDEPPVIFATHDYSLAEAARAMHFDVIGSPT